ncbi:MAG: hypothetical protein HQL19_03485 [Candidatus Omnitrophica bacterium]|nr:hypothetical protein [Candidatus Omnitrophota bacterium]
MKNKRTWIMGVFTGLVVLAFFLPWVEVQSSAVGAISKLLTGKRQATLDTISGFQVPIMANGPDARFMVDIITIFNPGIKNADKKSWLIWVDPLFAVLLGVFYVRFWNKKWFQVLVGAVGVCIFAVGVFYIARTDLNKLIINVKIASGLWLTLVGYLGIGVVAMTALLEKK